MSVVAALPGVSFIVPVRNGAPWLRETLDGIARQADGRAMEIIAIDDASTDDSRGILEEFATRLPLRILDGGGRGAAAALNTGMRAARHPILCQVDQDVRLHDHWMRRIVPSFDDERVGATQGRYVNDPVEPLWARVTALDLEQRYDAIAGADTTHVCTGNAAYRADAVRAVGGFDESLGYGYDNDMSYRLRDGGWRLIIQHDARSVHHWRDTFVGYCIQQYGFGYGRLDLVSRDPRRATGDTVSRLPMMLRPLVMLIALASFGWAPAIAALLAGALIVERMTAGVRAASRYGDHAALFFPVAHLVRDGIWAFAALVWMFRRGLGHQSTPEHSMKPRPVRSRDVAPRQAHAVPTRLLGLIPAHNEAGSLPTVIEDLRRACPDLDLLVIDDGSIDATPVVLETLGVRYIRLRERLGVGSAMRAGLTYAVRLGYDGAVRLDGDGQHAAEDVERVVGPLQRGEADVVLGSRYLDAAAELTVVRALQGMLAICLSTLTRARVTDPTSGFCAFGPGAMRVLADHHPTGYPEPELRLFLSRNGLNVVERPVGSRPRLSGRTSLTPTRLATAAARVLLALVVVPLRTGVRTPR